MKKIVNRRARYDYQLDKTLVVGIVLKGGEVKAIRNGRVSLKTAYVKFDNAGELWLVNLSIHRDSQDGDPAKQHKLLATKNQLKNLKRNLKNYQTIVVLDLVLGHYIKATIALAKGRRRVDKRQLIKKRQFQRSVQRELKRQ